VAAGHFAGGALDGFNPFSLMAGTALIPGYMLLGATYVIIKATGPVQERAYRQAFWSALLVAAFMALVSLWTPIHDRASRRDGSVHLASISFGFSPCWTWHRLFCCSEAWEGVGDLCLLLAAFSIMW
jgi:cytochrome bd-type quinol oxidase subunit 2